jgi:hypothetical protein
MTSGGPTQMHISPNRHSGNNDGWTTGWYYRTSNVGTSTVTIGQVCISEIRKAGGIRLLDVPVGPKTSSYVRDHREFCRSQWLWAF